MKKQVVNPFLPSYEYIPDGEPHVFGDRVYLYGSHDRFNGRAFCLNDYVCYSAPLNDLSAWRYEGVIWRRKDDPEKTTHSLKSLYAPDVVQGKDGRFYLYYFKGNERRIGVAVCDTPAGRYRYLGRVRYPDGTILGRGENETDIHQFDPGVFRDDDGKIYLYTGMAPEEPTEYTAYQAPNLNGAMAVELEEDMLTVKLPLQRIGKTVRTSKGTPYEGHEFFEASSMRKFNGKYYFIYSSVNNHELCYAMGDSPMGEFEYKGVLISIGDLGLSEKPLNYLGNTHGSIERINGKYYVFYHRQTNRHTFSRQACAEEIEMQEDGTFKQAELTSCGLNGGPLKAKGTYEARIACHLFSRKGTTFYILKEPKGCYPYFTQTGRDREENGDQYIANFCNGATAGFKYFSFEDNQTIGVTVKGKATGMMIVKDGLDGNVVASIKIEPSLKEKTFKSALTIANGVSALYFNFQGKGALDFISFRFD
ncbi:MAG: family 43 glycosylhydrolase [Clostridia bacterium]|nr:family 43 glycosylhydrolase [Clostridia bacterium]